MRKLCAFSFLLLSLIILHFNHKIGYLLHHFEFFIPILTPISPPLTVLFESICMLEYIYFFVA